MAHSIVRNSSRPVSVTPLILSQLPIKARGLTEFTFSRFLVPYLCGYEGLGLFVDPDMAVTGDIAELFDCADGSDVMVMKDQPKFEHASVMLFDCAKNTVLTPEFIDASREKLFSLDWAETVGSLPKEWNHCVGYEQTDNPKLWHWTQGVPSWFETKDSEGADIWNAEVEEMNRACSWSELMGNSVHANSVLKRMFTRYVGK